MKLKDNTLALVCRGNMRGHNSEIDAITMTRLSHPSSLIKANKSAASWAAYKELGSLRK